MGTHQLRMAIIIVHFEEDLAAINQTVREQMMLGGDFPQVVSKPFHLDNSYACIFIAPSGSKVGWARHREHHTALSNTRTALERLGKPCSFIYLEDGELGCLDSRTALGGPTPRDYYNFTYEEKPR